MVKSTVPKNWVKISEFERITGLNNRTITLAINRGNIPADLWQRVGSGKTSPVFINPQPAALYWYKNINTNHHLTKHLREKLADYIRSFNPGAVDEVVENQGETTINEKEATVKKNDGDKITYAEALRRKEVAKAKTAELEVMEKEGSLVMKQKVQDQLFAAGKEIRDALLAVPDRITDEVIAAVENRTKVNNIIYDAIAGALEQLSDLHIK